MPTFSATFLSLPNRLIAYTIVPFMCPRNSPEATRLRYRQSSMRWPSRRKNTGCGGALDLIEEPYTHGRGQRHQCEHTGKKAEAHR